MNNILISIKRFFMNKNVVTIIGVVAAMGLLYYVYNSKINEAVAPVQIPVATTTIQPRTLITDEMIKYIDVPSSAVADNVIQSKSLIVGKYTNINTVIPEGSMFYKQVLINKEDLPDTAFVDISEGEIPYAFPVTMESTYGNSMLPGTKIDIYMKAEEENQKGDEGETQIMFGKLLENVKILAVKDSSGKNVFENTAEERIPAFIIFGVTEEIHTLLRKASYMGNYGVELVPVPHGLNVSTEGTLQVSTEYLKQFINNHTVVIGGETDKNTNNQEIQPGA